MVRLQRYELVLKDVLARQRLEGIADPQEEDGRLLDEVPLLAPPLVGFRFVLRLDRAKRASFEVSLLSLVRLRNELVHGFIAIHDVGTVDGCKTAASYLEWAHEEIDGHLDHLRGIYRTMSEGYSQMGSPFQDPRFTDCFFHGIRPNGEGVDWAASTAVRLLRHAEEQLAKDGSTSLSDAASLIHALAPAHTPSKYGCSSWRQVEHEARPLFIARRAPGDGLTPGDTVYRSVVPGKA